MRYRLSDAPLRKMGVIADFSLPRKQVLTLNALGLVLGQPVQRMANLPLGGPVVVQVGHALLALEGHLADRIQVVIE